MLLIAGTSADRSLWSAVRPTLNQRYLTIAFDNRDAGASSIASENYTVGDLVADAVAVLQAVGVERAHVLGHSMGGMIAQELAIAQSDRVISLTLANSWARADVNARSIFELAGDLTAALEDDLLRLRALYVLGLGPATLSAMPLTELASGVLAAGPLQPRAALLRQWHLNLTLDTLERLHLIQAPTNVIWSTHDRFFPAVHARQLVEGIAGARETTLNDGVGHCPLIENPPAFAQVTLRFLADELAAT